jgi:D-sedoheptulose 7-phosphate isomerase
MKNSVQMLLDDCLSRFPQLNFCKKDLCDTFDAIVKCYSQGGKLLICGNGGSASDAEHIVGELMKKFRVKRSAPCSLLEKMTGLGFDDAQTICAKLEPALPAFSLVSQSSLITAIINDIGGDMIFAQQVYGYGKPGDILFGISTSGNSSNVINAIKVARALDMVTIGFTNENGGVMKSLCDVTIRVAASITFQVQELHFPAYHLLCSMVEEEFFGS